VILATTLIAATLLFPLATPVPTMLEIDALGMAGPVVEVGNTANLGMEIPSDVSNIGWWKHGPTPGETGNAVMVAHVSTRVDGVPTRGIFYDLIDLEIGDPVTVINHNSAEGLVTFIVTAVVVIPKAELPWEEIFVREGWPGLVLITCGGEFNGETRHFESNVIVYARMVP
jgi:sortase (surface protein transpeptidase)